MLLSLNQLAMPRTKQSAAKTTHIRALATSAAKKMTKPGAGGVKAKRRYAAITLACRSIRREQRDSATTRAFKHKPFTLLVRSVLADYMSDARVSVDAVLGMLALVEDKMTSLCKDAFRARLSAQTKGQSMKRCNIQVDDKHLRLASGNWAQNLRVGNFLESISDHRDGVAV